MSARQKRKYPVTRGRIFAGICCFVLAAWIGINAYLNPVDESPYESLTMVCWEDASVSRSHTIIDSTTVSLVEAVVQTAVENKKDDSQPMGYPRVEVFFVTEQGSEEVFRIDENGVMNVPGSSENYMVGKWQSDTYEQLLSYLPESD